MVTGSMVTLQKQGVRWSYMNRWDLSLQALRNDLEVYEKQVIDTEEQHKTPCDYPDNNGHFHYPFNAQGGDDCRRFCGLGVDD